jgi:hypothetical protein
MTSEQREKIRLERNAAARRNLERGRRRRGDRSTCSRCLEPLTDEDRSPGRPWHRTCENERRREHYQRT